ncbi:hypothetical protein LOAG_10777 [Loa loa]|uniref:Ground-like domain-containing protein n=1 Tax=Loa loa TaxID=7209 RepID=A0A1I7VZG3_LOALO|nr:hypothetical protein LOAG_10777 [Loa loa]EFO17721.2 hypothetical protein LOAG_10777 [Loa loa]
MLWNIERNILIIQLFLYSIPCFCFRSIPLWHCIPTCFQVPIVEELEVLPPLPFSYVSPSSGESYAQQHVQVQPQKRYISGESYSKHFSSSDIFHQFNDINLPQQQQQQQQYEQNELWQPDQPDDESIIYIAETTPNPYNELLDGKQLITRQPQPVPMFNQYDDNYLMEALNDISNHTTSNYPSPIAAMEGTSEDSKNNLQRTSFNVLKRRKTTKDVFGRNYPTKRVIFPSAICNSRKLRNVILQAITTDVSESKRSITKAAEHAYQGIKFDVICAEGDFSYTVHAKKYCEVTKENMTCFVFR